MTLYYSLVFALLVAEMALFGVLITPMPFAWRRRLFIFLSENPIIAKIQYGLKITFIFILILFIDSVNRVYRVELEVLQAKKANVDTIGGSVRSEVQARKFYSQRNMYLCGFTLFLSLILNRTYVMILDTLRLEEEVKRLSGDPKAAPKSGASGELGEAAKLKKELATANAKVAALQKQTEGLQKEYNRLGDQKTGVFDGTAKKDK